MGLDTSLFHNDRMEPQPASPTDISQFIRLDQCQRFLRLQLHERAHGDDFLTAYDVTRQTIPPILTRSGASFEQLVEAEVSDHLPATRFTDERRQAESIRSDNDALLALVRALAPGEAHVAFQPRLEAQVDGWRLRGDIDLLRLERDVDGRLHCLIADMKSSTAAKVEHRLQVAIYHEMLATILVGAGIAHEPIALAILYRGPVADTTAAEQADPELLARQREDGMATLGTTAGYLERIDDAAAHIGSVRDLLTAPESVARRALAADFDAIPFHLSYKCDGCHFNEFCMKRSAETDDLSLLPHLTEQDKTNLRTLGITTVDQVAALKVPDPANRQHLLPAPGHEELCRRLAVTWPIGQRLDELIHRAHRYVSWKHGGREGLRYIPHKGYGTLPAHNAELHPNLVKVYIDAQHDYLHDRVYMLGSLVVACDNGVEDPARRRTIVKLTPVAPAANDIERELYVAWIRETLEAVVALAAPDAEGRKRAPIHLVFVNRFAQKQLLNGLGRYMEEILGSTALYDFMTQLAAYDSPVASFLEQEIREQKNYPMVCQSLQAVASFLGFDWDRDEPYRDLFRVRMFDFWRKFDEPTPGVRSWYAGRARFNSQIPLEYAYAAWDELTPEHDPDAIAFFEMATRERLAGFHARRLEAMEHVAHDFRGNDKTQLRAFDLPDLATFEERAPSLAHALDEFVTIERFVELGAWKHERLAPPEQRVLNGVSLIVRYDEHDQDQAVLEQAREYRRREALEAQYRAAYLGQRPDAKQVRLTNEQKAACKRSLAGMRFRLSVDVSDVACSLEDALTLTTLKPGSRMILAERWTVDSRLPEAEQRPLTPTAKQLLYGQRVDLVEMCIERDADTRPLRASAVVELTDGGGGGSSEFYFRGDTGLLRDGTLYTLEPDINNYYGYWEKQTIKGLIAGERNLVYDLLTGRAPTSMPWPETAAAGQRRFLDGLDALHAAGAMHDFEPSKRRFIGDHGDAPLLLVQGPPGTGKSYTTAFAILARIQGAMAANIPFRVFLGCRNHNATDVLLHNVQDAIRDLRGLSASHPKIMERFFDRRLLDLPLYRLRPNGPVREGIISLENDRDQARHQVEVLQAHDWVIVGTTPGRSYGLVKDRWSNKDLFGHHLADCVVLDEASQMGLPEAVMATLPLAPEGRLIVVGDHRQMPPIVKHNWAEETRRTFRDFKTYESLFLALLALAPPKINFERSFRLHADMAEFLRREIYRHDGIHYYSTLDAVLPAHDHPDPFVAAVLNPRHPLTVIVHDERQSQHRNVFEQDLITPVLEALADERAWALGPDDGLGVVVPHRAQRSALQEAVPTLSRYDVVTGELIVSAVDTVERFQGGERTVIMVSATESDPEYLLATGDFLLDPRRLTVALSRAKRKIVLVASRSVFELFSADAETFANAQLWKNLLRGTCTVPLWSGERDGHRVQVWGNAKHPLLPA